jgi:hypothetical protein
LSYANNNMRKYIPVVELTPYTQDEYIDTMPSSYRKFKGKVLTKVGKWLKSFVKKERVDLSKYKAPRLIQANTQELNICLGRYIKKLEHKVYAIDKSMGYDNFSKQNTLQQQAEQIIRKTKKFVSPKFVCLDMSAFDSSITNAAKSIESTFVKRCYKSCYRNFQTYLDQKKTVGWTTNGVKYKVEGTRNSGSVMTSFGNSIISYNIMCYVFKKLLNIKHCEILVNGDDSLVIMENSTHLNVPEMKLLFSKLNFNVTIDQITSNLNEVEFCQTKVAMDDNDMPMSVLIKDKYLKNLGMTHKNISLNDYYRDILYANSIIYKNYKPYHEPFHEAYVKYDKIATKPLLKYLKENKPLERMYHREIVLNKTFYPSHSKVYDPGDYLPTIPVHMDCHYTRMLVWNSISIAKRTQDWCRIRNLLDSSIAADFTITDNELEVVKMTGNHLTPAIRRSGLLDNKNKTEKRDVYYNALMNFIVSSNDKHHFKNVYINTCGEGKQSLLEHANSHVNTCKLNTSIGNSIINSYGKKKKNTNNNVKTSNTLDWNDIMDEFLSSNNSNIKKQKQNQKLLSSGDRIHLNLVNLGYPLRLMQFSSDCSSKTTSLTPV